MDLAAYFEERKATDISLAIADALGDFHEEAAAPLAKVVSPSDPLAVPNGSCPKCIAARSPEAAACPNCGLAYSRFHPESVEPSDGLLQAFAWLQAADAKLEEHLRLLTRADLLGELPQVVRLYRIWLVRSPGNAIGEKVLQEAVKIASAQLASAPPEPKSTFGRNLIMFLLVVGFLAIVSIKTFASLHP